MPASSLLQPNRVLCKSLQILKCTIAVSLVSLPASAQQQTDDLQKQLQEIKQQYEQTTRQMQQRISTLEQQIQRQSAEQQAAQLELATRITKEQEDKARQKQEIVSAAQLAAEQTAKKILSGDSNQVGSKYQGLVPYPPTYDFVQEARVNIQKLQTEVGSFEFHGYFRSGYGLNSEGGQQVAFQAPGAGAKYRLGNEAETYGEFIFVNNWLNPDRAFDKAWMKTEVMIEANTTNSASYANFPNGVGNDQFRLREAFVQGGNILEHFPDAKFWAGERYYRRQHIEIDDFYPLDMSGYGGGIEDLHLGPGHLAVAYLAGARPDLITQNGVYGKSNIDTRFYGFKVPGGDGGVWFDFATAKGGTTSTGLVIPTSNGYAFGFRHERLEWHGGFNWASIEYGRGGAPNGTAALTGPASSTAGEPPATTALPSMTQPARSETPKDSSYRNRCSSSPTTSSPSCPSSSTSEQGTATHSTAPTSGSPLGRGQYSSSTNIFRSRSKAEPTTPVVTLDITKDGSASSPSLPRSAQAASSPAVPTCVSSLPTPTGQTDTAAW